MNAYQAGQGVLLGDYSQYTPTGKSFFVKKDRYYDRPQKYDIVYFYTENLKRVSHVGFVYKVKNNSDGSFDIWTYEGNTSAGAEFNRNGGILAKKHYPNIKKVGGGARIDGFGRPDYAEWSCTGEDVLAVLEKWVDYEEKDSWIPLEAIYDKHANPGRNNITMFGYWYAGNKKVPAQWCQQTISWSVYQACVERAARKNKKNGWIELVEGGWSYWTDEGPVRNQWRYIDGRWYVFDGSGKMITGWFKQNEGDWYYLAKDGGMLSNQWAEIEGKYYFFTESGLMARNAYVRSRDPIGPGEIMYYWVNSMGEYEGMWDTYVPDLEKYDVV